MTKTILRFGSLILAASLAFAADKPNFSGSWKMDSTKSDFGGGPPPDSFTRKVEHNGPSLILTDEQTSQLGTEKVIRNYTIGGPEITYQWMSSDVKSAAHWEENAMVIVGKLNAGGTDIIVNSTLTLSADGTTLTENGKIVAEGNEVAAYKVVLVKQ